MLDLYNDISLMQFVIPGLTKPAPYLIRGNPVYKILVPCFRRDNVWIPAFAGMARFVMIGDAVHNFSELRTHYYELLFVQVRFNFFHQLIDLEGFGDIFIRSCLLSHKLILLLGLCGQHQDGNVFVPFIKF